MSGYGDRRQGGGGRDYRERSPDRGGRPPYRERDDGYGGRGRDDGYRGGRGGGRGGRGDYGGGRGGGSYGSSSRGGSPYSSGPAELLPDLPETVPIPEKGARLDLPVRPQRGTAGRQIMIAVNHFPIQSLPVVKTYQYEVKMAVPPSSQRRGSDKVTAMQQTKAMLQAVKLWGQNFVFDNVSLGWSTDLLMEIGEEREATLALDGHTPEKPNEITIVIRNAGTLNVRKFVQYLSTSGRTGVANSDPAIEDCFKALNAVYRQDPASRFITRPKSTAYFHRVPSLCLPLQSTGGILEAMRGAFQAVSYSFGRLSLNVDVACSAFYTPDLCILDVAKSFAGMPPRQDINPGSLPMFRQGCERLIGLFFVVRHLRTVGTPKKIRIQKITAEGARQTTFPEKNRATGEETIVTVEDYMNRKYNIRLQYPDIPMIVSRDGLFPMELCFTPQGERYKEALQGQETADFIKWATSPAFKRAEQIVENVKRFNWHTLAIPATMGLSVQPSMLVLPGRVMPSPIPVYGSGSDTRGPENGQWNLRNKTFLKPAGFNSWGLLYLPGGGRIAQDRDIETFARAMAGSLQSTGLTSPRSPPAVLKGNPHGNLKEEIDQLIQKTGSMFRSKPELLVFLLHEGANTNLYKTIKSVCEVEYGIPSQVMLVEKALKDRGQAQYLGNIGMKVNCKLGGINCRINEPLFRQSRFMMLGGDTSHPSPGELRRLQGPPSYCALVGTYDQDCVAYSAVASSQDATQELIQDIKPMLKELLKRYESRNNAIPECIIYWRDGISESQIEAFRNSEIRGIKETFEEVGRQVKITVINCVKRHHTRMFPKSEQGDKLGNVFPGTVLENSKKDFFLVSQSALQGTVRPCHYSVIMDENKLTDDDFQRLALNATFSYGRATRSVSIHPAVYYADQVAERAKLHLVNPGDESLKDVHQDLRYTMYWQ